MFLGLVIEESQDLQTHLNLTSDLSCSLAKMVHALSEDQRFCVCGYVLLCSGLGIVGNRWFKYW